MEENSHAKNQLDCSAVSIELRLVTDRHRVMASTRAVVKNLPKPITKIESRGYILVAKLSGLWFH